MIDFIQSSYFRILFAFPYSKKIGRVIWAREFTQGGFSLYSLGSEAAKKWKVAPFCFKNFFDKLGFRVSKIFMFECVMFGDYVMQLIVF